MIRAYVFDVLDDVAMLRDEDGRKSDSMKVHVFYSDGGYSGPTTPESIIFIITEPPSTEKRGDHGAALLVSDIRHNSPEKEKSTGSHNEATLFLEVACANPLFNERVFRVSGCWLCECGTTRKTPKKKSHPKSPHRVSQSLPIWYGLG